MNIKDKLLKLRHLNRDMMLCPSYKINPFLKQEEIVINELVELFEMMEIDRDKYLALVEDYERTNRIAEKRQDRINELITTINLKDSIIAELNILLDKKNKNT